MVEVFGVRVLIQGPSGADKSEAALPLVETTPPSSLVDDLVEVSLMGLVVLASRIQVASHYMEIRGLSIINISYLYGAGAVLESKNPSDRKDG